MDFARAIELKPGDPRPHLQRGDLHAKNGDRATAIRCFTRVIELTPKDATAHRKRAVLNSADGKHAALLADLEKVAELEPTAEAFKELARLRLDCPDLTLRDAKKAVELADKAWALSRLTAASPENDFSYSELRASAAAATGDPERAVTILSGVLSSHKSHSGGRALPAEFNRALPPPPEPNGGVYSAEYKRLSDRLDQYKRIAELRRPNRVAVTEDVVVRGQMVQLPPLPPALAARKAGKDVRPPAEVPPLSEVGKSPPGELLPIIIPEIGKN